MEIETPILLQSSPEGAREFLVPSRSLLFPSPTSSTLSSNDGAPSTAPEKVKTGQPQFYALPQSPQQPKQLLISSGLTERYFQVARCFRDEGSRKDRQPEFTQVDLEMGFVSGAAPTEGEWNMGGSEIRRIVEGLMGRIWNEVQGQDVLGPKGEFRVMQYRQAIEDYGSDKPDLRFDLKLQNIHDLLSDQVRTSLDKTKATLDVLIPPSDWTDVNIDSDTVKAAPQVERLVVGSPSPSRLAPDLDLSVGGSLAKELNLTEGGTLWLGQRTRMPEGGSTDLGRVRTGLMADAVSKGASSPSVDRHIAFTDVLITTERLLRSCCLPPRPSLPLGHRFPALHQIRPGQELPRTRTMVRHAPPVHLSRR